MRSRLVIALVTTVALAIPAAVAAHDLDHPAPAFVPQAPPVPVALEGGDGADWEFVDTIATGNPHTDLDFFERGGETYASVGTLGTGPNSGGQTIVRLTGDDGRRVNSNTVEFVAGHPSAACASNPADALGLQHDVESSPKGGTILNTGNRHAVRSQAQVIVDASDAPGRCHDQGPRVPAPECVATRDTVCVPQGGLEIVDVTDPANPKEIGLTSHIGESHTVNIDPKRPHIAYSVTSDAVSIDETPGDGIPNGTRENEIRGDNDKWDLDGFEVVDMSSCMYFDPGTSIAEKRAQCRPEVYRYRYPTKRIALGHTLTTTIYGCHELEIYPSDKLTCGSGAAMIYFDMERAFRDMGTPTNFKDDKLRGEPLPCRVRPSSSSEAVDTGARITDCVFGKRHGGPGDSENRRLSIPEWQQIGSPSLAGVRHIGSAHHQGRGATDDDTGVTPAFDSTQDIDFDHEAELTASREFVIATDERGGGVVPPGASCASAVDNRFGNGGLHAYDVDRLDKEYPARPRDAFQAYAREPDGGKAIYRARVRTGVEESECTAHVFQQIPGQNRIFMGWYSQGTQVVDFVEKRDGTVRFKEAGFFIPANANTWVSHVFKMRKNANGDFTYWGATGDFALGTNGRSAIDVYKVTLPAPPKPR